MTWSEPDWIDDVVVEIETRGLRWMDAAGLIRSRLHAEQVVKGGLLWSAARQLLVTHGCLAEDLCADCSAVRKGLGPP